MNLDDFQAYEETAYLMASAKKAKRLNKAALEIKAGNVINKGLIEE